MDLDNTIKVLDVCNGEELISIFMDYISIEGVYELDNDRFFIGLISESRKDVEVWEFEFELKRLEVVDIKLEELIKIDFL